MDYAHLMVRDTAGFFSASLFIEVHFSPDQIAIIDRCFFYEEILLHLHQGTYKVSYFIGEPCRQTCTSLSLRYPSEFKDGRWLYDCEHARKQLDDFRWRLIRLSRQAKIEAKPVQFRTVGGRE